MSFDGKGFFLRKLFEISLERGEGLLGGALIRRMWYMPNFSAFLAPSFHDQSTGKLVMVVKGQKS